MRLHTENTEAFIYLLAAAISKDPASLDAWRCLHIHPSPDHSWDIAALTAIKNAHRDSECDVVRCPDEDLLIISREMSDEEMKSLAGEITAGLGESVEINRYDLFYDWRRIRFLLLSKTKGAEPKSPEIEEKADFGDVGALSDVFASAKQLRRARNPQYVMVVEDDALTRRVVASAFKENYALITAQDAGEAIANYLMHAPDIVFLDIGLPDASGFAVLKQILASDPDAYVVMFSGNSYLDNVTTALAAGASGFIAKPFKKEKLRRYIQDSALHHRKA